MHLLLFLSPDWLILSHDYLSYNKLTRFFINFLFLSDEGPTLKMSDFTIRIRSTPTFSYFNLIKHIGFAPLTLSHPEALLWVEE